MDLRNRCIDIIEIQTNLSSSFSSIGDDRSLDLSDDLLQQTGLPPLQPDLVVDDDDDDDSLQMLTILASSSFDIEQMYQNSFELAKDLDVPSHITTSSRKRTISQHDETATTYLSNATTTFAEGHRPRFYSEGGEKTVRSLSQSQQLSIRDVASMLGSLSILDSSEQLKTSAFHHRATCDQLPDADELFGKLGDEKSHRRNTQVVLINEAVVS